MVWVYYSHVLFDFVKNPLAAFLRISPHLLKKSLMGDFIFCVVQREGIFSKTRFSQSFIKIFLNLSLAILIQDQT